MRTEGEIGWDTILYSLVGGICDNSKNMNFLVGFIGELEIVCKAMLRLQA